VKEFNVETKG